MKFYILLTLVSLACCSKFVLNLQKAGSDGTLRMDLVQRFSTEADPVLYATVVSIQICHEKGLCAVKNVRFHFERSPTSWIKVHAKILDGAGTKVRDAYFQQPLVETNPETEEKEPSQEWQWYTVSSMAFIAIGLAVALIFLIKIRPKGKSVRKEIVSGYDFKKGEVINRRQEVQKYLVEKLKLYTS